jgi:O-antigen/teichoic acid export membrane protein
VKSASEEIELTPAPAAPALVRRRRVTRSLSADPLFHSAYSLILSTVATAVLGLGYWILAAREYPAAVLGQASAAISAMLMLSNFAQMNLFHGLARFVPAAGRLSGRLIGWAYLASGAAALALATAFVLVAPRISDGFEFLDGPLAGAAFVAAVALWGLFALQDGVLTALHKASWVPIENVLFGLVKLGLLLLFATVFVDEGIFASWNIPVLLAVIPVNLLIFRRLVPLRKSIPAGEQLRPRRVSRFVAVDYVGSLLLQTYTTALPLVIVAMLGAEANATFYVAYVIIAALDLVSVNLATALTVEAAHHEHRLAEYARRVLLRSGALLVPAVAVLVAGAPQLLDAFGDRYANDSVAVLQLLALGSLPRMVNIVYMGAMRVEQRVHRVVRVQAMTSVVVLSLTLLLTPSLGIQGVAVAWTCAHLAVAASLLPWLLRTLRGPVREAA